MRASWRVKKKHFSILTHQIRNFSKNREPRDLLTSHPVSAAYDKCITLDISFLLIKGTLIWTSTETSKLPFTPVGAGKWKFRHTLLLRAWNFTPQPPCDMSIAHSFKIPRASATRGPERIWKSQTLS